MTQKIELWAGGDVRSRNVGPAAGDHFLGKIEGPGLYNFLADNATGKSHHLRMLELFAKERLLRSDADITDGADVAVFEVGSAMLAFRRLPTGEIAEPHRSGVETLPPIETMPRPIDLLLKAADVKGEEPRLRARLGALLAYSPIPSGEEFVRLLCKVLEARPFSRDPGAERRGLWDGLAERAAAATKRFKPEKFATADEVLAFLLALGREGVLDDHDRLVDKLNALGNTGNKVAEQQRAAVAQAQGRLQESLAGAARRMSVPATPALNEKLVRYDGPEAGAIRIDLAGARATAAGKKVGVETRQKEEARRDRLRESHGEEPTIDAEQDRHGKAKAAEEAARAELARLREELAGARRSLEETSPRAEAAKERVRTAWEAWNEATNRVDRLFFSTPEAGSFMVPGDPALLLSASAEITPALAALQAAHTAALDDFRLEGDREREVEQKGAAVTAAERTVAAARDETLAREAELDGAKARRKTWAETAALLAAPVEGATDEDLAAAEAEVKRLEDALVLAEVATSHKTMAALLEVEEQALAWIVSVTDSYRTAAQESWSHLGGLVTKALALPWLSVDGLRIKLHYAGGRLRESFEQADEQVRDLDDADAISEAELHEGLLRLMLSRREHLGGILIIPGRMLHPLDQGKMETFCGWAVKAGLVVVSERPRRKGDPDEGLILERVPPRLEEEGAAA